MTLTAGPTTLSMGLTIHDLDRLAEADPDEFHVWELIDGVIIVSRAPHMLHQVTEDALNRRLGVWTEAGGHGVLISGIGVVFDEANAVIPDLVWVSRARMSDVIDAEQGRLVGAPDLIIEIASPGSANQRRDREVKRELYGGFGVREYWVLDWHARTLEIYRLDSTGLAPAVTLAVNDSLTSPMLPGFTVPVAALFTLPAEVAG